MEGMDGTGRLFEPLLAALPTSLPATAIAYPPGEPLGYEGLLPLVMDAAAQAIGPFVVVGESFSGLLALMLAASRPPFPRGVVLCTSFVRFPLPMPERWRHTVRPWMFRVQPLWLLSWGTAREAGVRTTRAAAPVGRAIGFAQGYYGPCGGGGRGGCDGRVTGLPGAGVVRSSGIGHGDTTGVLGAEPLINFVEKYRKSLFLPTNGGFSQPP